MEEEAGCQLGVKYTDELTGYKGVCTARTVFLHGCVRICLEAKAKGKAQVPVECWFDEQRLSVTTTATTGGPRSNPPSRSSG